MKKCICLMSLCIVCAVGAYQPTEPGLFGVFINPSEQQRKPLPVAMYEKSLHGSDSAVLIVNGASSFAKHVISESFCRPVVVKVHSIHSKDSLVLRPVFQHVATQYKNTVSCVSIDLFQQCAGSQENYRLIVALMNKLGITKIDLPVVMFFKNGSLYCPAHMQCPILVGSCSADFLAQQIEKKYFIDSFDMTTTSTCK